MLTDRRERRERPGADGTAGTAGTAGSAGSAGLPGARVRGPGIPRSEESDQCWESRTGVPRFYDGEVDQGPGTGVSRPRLFFMIPHCSPGTRTPMAESSMRNPGTRSPGPGSQDLYSTSGFPTLPPRVPCVSFMGGSWDQDPGTRVPGQGSRDLDSSSGTPAIPQGDLWGNTMGESWDQKPGTGVLGLRPLISPLFLGASYGGLL